MPLPLMNHACDFCRARKLKCSREPRCTSCIKYDKECTYTPRPRPQPLTKSYVHQLRRRIVSLESTLAKLQESKEEKDNLLHSISHDKGYEDLQHLATTDNSQAFNDVDIQESPDLDESEIHDHLNAEDYLYFEDFYNMDNLDWYEKDPAATSTDINENSTESLPSSNGLIDGMGALVIGQEHSVIKPHAFYGISSSNGLLRFLKSSKDIEQSKNNDIPSSSFDSRTHSNFGVLYNQNNVKLLKSENSDMLLDDRNFRNELVSSYFGNHHYCYPFINKNAFLRDYKSSRTTKGSDPNSIKNISFQVLLNTVLAIGALCKFGEFSIIDLLYYKRVKSILKEINIMECGNYQLLSAFILLGNYVQKRNKPNTGWNYQGLCLRMAISLGLHKEINKTTDSHLSQFFEMRERRRRLWWGLFFLMLVSL